jgi:hypothetical protein
MQEKKRLLEYIHRLLSVLCLIISLPISSLLLKPTVHSAHSRACTGVPGDRADGSPLRRAFGSRALCVLGLLRSRCGRIDTRLLFRRAIALVFVFGCWP